MKFLGRSTFKFTAPPPQSLYLISGSITYLNDKASHLRQEQFIFCMDGHRKFRSLPSAFIPLSRIKHQAVGGASTYLGIWGCHGINISPHFTSLRRQIGDYIDYSLPPSTLPPNQTTVKHNQLLPIQNIHSWIAFPSPYRNSDVGYKQLNVSELSHLFGFPTSHKRLHLTKDSFPMVPLQVLDAIIRPVYSVATHKEPSLQLQIPSHQPESTATYLPTINKVLPHAWRNAATQSEGAAKADDAAIPTYLWDTRISSIYPMFTSSWLTSLRHVLLGYKSKCIYNEFVTYMRTKYIKGSFCPKNNRGVKGVGLIEMERLFKQNSDLNNKEVREEFFRDLSVGKQVLHHYMSSSYQGWDQGSSLIFWGWPIPMRKKSPGRDLTIY